MQHTLAAVFDNRTSAQQAMDELVRCGFPKEDLALKDASSAAASSAGGGTSAAGFATAEGERDESFGQSVKHFFSDLFGTGHADTHVYTEAVRRGNTVLTYETDDQDRVERAADIIEGYGPIDIDEHESQWRAGGWTGAEGARSGTYQASAPTSLQSTQQGTTAAGTEGSRQSAAAAGSMQRGQEGRPIPGMQEDLKLGTRTVQTGGVRVYSRLNDAPAGVDSGSAGLSSADEDYEPAYRYGFSMATAEMYRNRPWDEAEPTLRSDWERSHPGSAWERAKAAVRHGWDRMTSGGDDSAYRTHWTSNYANLGGKYEDYEPAYRYGSTMASNASYRNRAWDDVEPELRSDWERTHPGSAWDRFKAAVREGWDRMTGSADDDSYYRSHYSSTYGTSGASYDEYAPAYRYGSSMAGSDTYRGSQWDEVEPKLRSDWEQRYPGSAWERFKAAVRHGWDRITS